MQLAGAAEVNKHYLKLVDTALFVLCLDHTSPSTAAEVSYLVLLLTSLLKQWLSECVCVRWKVFGFDTHITMVWCNLYVRTYIHILVITSSFCLPFPSRRLGCVFLPILYVRTYVRPSSSSSYPLERDTCLWSCARYAIPVPSLFFILRGGALFALMLKRCRIEKCWRRNMSFRLHESYSEFRYSRLCIVMRSSLFSLLIPRIDTDCIHTWRTPR